MKKYTMDDFISKKIAVIVGTKHVDEFLKMCEARGLKWASGYKAANFKPPDKYGEQMCIAYDYLFPGLSFGSYETYAGNGPMIVRFCEISDKRRDRYQIIIDCDGDTTTAKMIINGKEVKAARAKRNPDDPFNWKLAASLAFNRLFGKKKPAYREVKRLAKAGEYIKLIRKEFHFNKEGDILRVSEIAPSGNPIVKESGHPRKPQSNAEGWCYSAGCFVVLEGYKPSK